MFSAPWSIAWLIRPHCFKVPLKASLFFKVPCVFFYSCKRMFCVYHSILMHLTAPKRGLYKKGIINWFQRQWCCLCDAISLTAQGSGTCRVTTKIFSKTFTETRDNNPFFVFIQIVVWERSYRFLPVGDPDISPSAQSMNGLYRRRVWPRWQRT